MKKEHKLITKYVIGLFIYCMAVIRSVITTMGIICMVGINLVYLLLLYTFIYVYFNHGYMKIVRYTELNSIIQSVYGMIKSI